MRVTSLGRTWLLRSTLSCALLYLLSTVTWAHCDTLRGPVVTAARAALEKKDIAPVLRWIKPEYEAEVRAAFALTLSVRDKGSEVQTLADRYFFETVVRLHRAGEGAPYTGLTDAPPEPIIMLSDQALETASPDSLIGEITAHVSQGIRLRFDKALEARRRADANVQAGREFVDAYVQFVHYVEGIQLAAESASGEHQRDTQTATAHAHDER